MYAIVNSASGRGDDKAMAWIMRPEKRGPDRAMYTRSTKDFMTLDKKLAAAIIKVANGELGREIHQYVEHTQTHEERMPKGRELWCMILQYYKTIVERQFMH